MQNSFFGSVITPLNHVAVTVTDIHAAAKWYRDTLQLEQLAGPILIDADDTSPTAQRLKAIFGSDLKRLWICHMLSADGAGIELFEFVEPKSELRSNNFEYWKTGYFHICLTEPQIDELAKKINDTGGKRRSGSFEIQPGRWICFCEDPFGNVIEIYSHSYEQFWRGS